MATPWRRREASGPGEVRPVGDERLAVDGGRPAIRRPAERFLIGREERDAVVALMDRAIAEGKAFDRYDGTQVEAYESEFARWLGLKYATAERKSGASVPHSLAGAIAPRRRSIQPASPAASRWAAARAAVF
jgi:hypothetical protein